MTTQEEKYAKYIHTTIRSTPDERGFMLTDEQIDQEFANRIEQDIVNLENSTEENVYSVITGEIIPIADEINSMKAVAKYVKVKPSKEAVNVPVEGSEPPIEVETKVINPLKKKK